MEKIYTSKVDTWMATTVGMAMFACVLVPFVTYQTVGPVIVIPGAVTILIGGGLPLWVFMSTRYRLTDTTLFVNTGPFKWEVPVREITKVTPTRDPLSSPALSLDRLRIDYGQGKALMISPKQKQEFIDDLEQRRARSH
jgi:Bacterial PH domain